MIKRNNITELLKGVEVEWKTLGEVTTILTAQSKVKKDRYSKSGKIPIIDQGEQFIAGYSNENIQPIESGEYIIFGDHSEHIKYVDFSFIQGADGIKILKTKNDNTKYIYYAFKNFYHKELSYKRHWSNAKETSIPIPPLHVQTEIARILDTFTALTAELTAELTTRKKQYNYYRDKLLTFQEDEVEWKNLGEIAKIKNGKDWKKLGDGDIPVYGTGGVMGYVNTHAYNKPTVLIPRKGSITNIFYLESPFWNVDTIYYTEIDEEEIIPKFFYYYMKTIDLTKLDTGSGRPSLTKAILDNINIPIPPLKEQARIVEILDKFDVLTNSITEGLPREIELRQKQYEYYRNLLLNFSVETQ
ncbi:MAG: restriction endonuclease subunit S [Gilliamella sp.]|uniref:restriction endonuclease subunit S n=1 Tax=unclassified Gilliamella TaxID=2685620 RepID=UPI0025FA7D80|nr:restriction endonuclease subunit S [Gilliamella sp.]MCO6540040.1 restriction endonuclease subunit S [Gilliamella sp.]